MGISYDKATKLVKENPNYAMRLETWDKDAYMSYSPGAVLPPEKFWSKVNQHIAANQPNKTLVVNGGFSLSNNGAVIMGYTPCLRDELKCDWEVYEFPDDSTQKPKRVNIK